MTSSTLLAGFLGIACLLTTTSVNSLEQHPMDANTAISPKWRVNLLPVIGSTPIGTTYGKQREYKALPHTSLWFVDNNRIVATFIVREPGSGLLSRGGSNSASPDRLRPVFIDSETGKVSDMEDWPAISMNAGIIAVHNRMFVVQVGSELTLYSNDSKPLRHKTLPTLDESEWRPYPSPTGKSILFVAPGHKTGRWLWVDTDSLEVTHSWQETETGDVAIADDAIAMVTCTWRNDCPRTVSVRGLNSGWHTIAPGHFASYPRFIDNSALFLSGRPSTLIRTNGRVVFADDGTLKQCESQDKVYPASDLHRFVAPSCVLEGAIDLVDMGGHTVLRRILINDNSSNGWSYTLGVKGPTIKGLTQFAVSPDGLRFALLNNGSVELFDLPASPRTDSNAQASKP